MRPLNEQTILITGASRGLGRQVAIELADKGATLLLHGSDPGRLAAIADEVRHMTHDDKIHMYLADFASLAEVKAMADRIAREHTRLDVLVNNAGIGFGVDSAQREVSKDGYELRLAVNYLAPFLLTHALLPLLQASAPARIVNVSSLGQAPLDFSDLMLEHGYDGTLAYRKSKLALIMLTFDLAEQLAGTGVTVNALHPATYMDTHMVRESRIPAMSSVQDGAAPTLRLITAPELDNVTGRFFDQMRDSRAREQAYDVAARARLKQATENLIARVVPMGFAHSRVGQKP
jgi:NAD(P)-dependent dehydrogenase (short-subunit alcohol dehydrogenase family)